VMMNPSGCRSAGWVNAPKDMEEGRLPPEKFGCFPLTKIKKGVNKGVN